MENYIKSIYIDFLIKRRPVWRSFNSCDCPTCMFIKKYATK